MNLNQSQIENHVMGLNPIFRSDSFGYYSLDQSYTMMEKRQLFLRSYQFCRKKSLTERIKGSLVRMKRVILLRLRTSRRLKKLVFSRFKCGFYYRRRRFLHLLNNHYYKSNSSTSCFWLTNVKTLPRERIFLWDKNSDAELINVAFS
ncbi:Lamin tail domain-containing protein [Quillaja saponaria]|uniref:Lamin tail domain-containing protein n=1 Tax=Quillaja saponaria TaxID=32244 RepID=A0AAD7VJ31_QUISA|nr:Lamin tail domain-containing protein [Quillaja saponaria]